MLRSRDIGLDVSDAEPNAVLELGQPDDDIATWLASRPGQSYTGEEDFGDPGGDWLRSGGHGVGQEPAS